MIGIVVSFWEFAYFQERLLLVLGRVPIHKAIYLGLSHRVLFSPIKRADPRAVGDPPPHHPWIYPTFFSEVEKTGCFGLGGKILRCVSGYVKPLEVEL